MKYLIVLLALLTTPAFAQQPMCAPRSDIIDQLSKQYKESPIALGLANNGSVIEILKSQTDTFTIIVTRPDGVTCMVAAGDSFQIINTIKKKGQES